MQLGRSLLLAAVMVAGCGGPSPVAAPPAPAAVASAPAAGPAAARSLDDRLAAPARLRFAGLGTDAAIVPVGVDGRGEMEVPVDVTTVGWYRFGPAPGTGNGSSVLAGHVDDRVQGRGAFYRLAELAPGDPVEVVLADGAVVRYRVSAVERTDKSRLPVDRVFGREGPPRLTLVTCGGEFDRTARSYRENVVVTAEPVGR